LVTVTGHWQSREGVTGDADEVACLPPAAYPAAPSRTVILNPMGTDDARTAVLCQALAANPYCRP
jgi:hypothetical protein